MSRMSFVTSNELQQFVSQAKPEHFEKALTQFSIRELADSYLWLDSDHPDDLQKNISLFEYIASSDQLEPLGKYLGVKEFHHLLNFLIKYPSYKNKLSQILIGLPSHVFCAALNFYQTAHLALFKEIGLLEPLHYHLTQFVHECETIGQHVAQQLQLFEADLAGLNPLELTREGLERVIGQIDAIRNQLLEVLEKVSVALSIAWNTERIDLIERLSTVNEALQHQVVLFVGHRASDTLPATGFYLEVETTLSRVFEPTLQEHDAATEGLTCLGVWHLKDYWELGLIPEIHDTLELGDLSGSLKDSQPNTRKQNLFSQVQKKLESLHIGTIGELKKKHIFSKALLKTYIAEN